MEVDLAAFLGLVGLLIALGATLFGLALYSGFNFVPEVTVGPPPLPKAQIAYKFLKGPYGGSAVGATFTEATSIAPKAPVLGIFYDNPQEVEEERLRCAVGTVVESDGEATVSEAELELLKKKGFSLFSLPGIGASVNSSFPHRTSVSVRLAPLRVYPRLAAHIADKDLCAYPMLELYGGPDIQFAAPLSQQDAFFVPEAEEDESEPEDLGSELMEDSADSDQNTSSDASDASDKEETSLSDPDKPPRESATESDFEQIDMPNKAPKVE